MAGFGRSVAFGVASTLLVIAALCVLDARLSVRNEGVAESADLIGNDLLKAQAKALNDERHLKNKGKDMASIDTMLQGFQEPENSYDSLTDSLLKQAPKKDDLEVALSPDSSGLVHFDLGKEEKKSAIPDFADDIEFVQSIDEWVPSGQDGLKDDIESMKSADEEAAMKEDHLEGHGVLSAVGLVDDEAEETFFVHEDAVWEPAGQEGMSDAIAKSRIDDDEQEARDNGLEGYSVLSSVGITKDSDDAENAEFSDDELGLVQVAVSADNGAWVPSGQGGLADAIQGKKDEDDAAEAKEDGLEGDTLLSSAGVQHSETTPSWDEEDTEFLQDQVAEWQPKGQQVKARHTYTESKGEEEERETSYAEDGLDGEDLLSAVGLGDRMKPADEATDLGTIKSDDFDVNDLV